MRADLKRLYFVQEMPLTPTLFYERLLLVKPKVGGRGLRGGVWGGAPILASARTPGRAEAWLIGRSGHSSIRALPMFGMPMWVVRRIRVDCPNLPTGVSTQEGYELIDTDHGRSSDSLHRRAASSTQTHLLFS
jgi:hypothetical protein